MYASPRQGVRQPTSTYNKNGVKVIQASQRHWMQRGKEIGVASWRKEISTSPNMCKWLERKIQLYPMYWWENQGSQGNIQFSQGPHQARGPLKIVSEHIWHFLTLAMFSSQEEGATWTRFCTAGPGDPRQKGWERRIIISSSGYLVTKTLSQ